jgi:hypothetical protein
MPTYKSLPYAYDYTIKYNPLKQTFKIVRHKIEKATNRLISSTTIHKNVASRPEAEQIVFLLTRNKK